MKMNFNELSSFPLSDTKSSANEKIERLIKTFGDAMKLGFKKIRFDKHRHEILLAENYTVNNWLNETNQRNLKDLLLGIFEYPFIAQEDVVVEDEYLSHRYYFEDNDNGIVRTECLGLAAAHIYETLAISFSGSPSWENNFISIEKVKDGINVSEIVEVSNVFTEECLNKPQISQFIEQISEVNLVKTNIPSEQKKKNFSGDHHGNNELKALAEKLVNSPYVIEIIHSLPYSSRAVNFVKEIYPDGKIDLVLFWLDAGYGMRIQTTGRNLRETAAIAEILEDKYV